MRKARLGCVPYLNARPLIAYFETPEGEAVAEVTYAPPSEFGALLESGELDAALASSFFALSNPEFRYAPGIGIASEGPVESVRLFSTVPFSAIRSLALDAASMTSNHLARIILAERYGAFPDCIQSEAELELALESADAAVLIGDRGLTASGDGLKVMDLGAAWTDWTGLPFVWAMWIGGSSLSLNVTQMLGEARDYGRARVEEIAKSEAVRMGVSESRCLRYLAEVIDYDLSEAHLRGFEKYGAHCRELGFLEAVRTEAR